MLKLSSVFIAVALISFVHGSLSRYSLSTIDFKNYVKQYIEPTSAVLSIDSFQDSCEIRQAPGFVCMNCEVLGRCVFRNGNWETIALEACDAGQGLHCHSGEGKCSANPGPCNGGGIGDSPFVCTSTGIFPNPHNCQMYHMCFFAANNMIAANILCIGNQAFNPVTSDCSLTTTHQICQGRPFTCDTVGQMGAWPLNANIYYICVAKTNNGIRVLHPQLYRCPIGYYYYNEDCVPNGITGGPPGSPPGSSHRCSRPGLFPDPTNCRAYFFCDGNLRSQHIMCPSGTYFSQNIMGCVRGNC